MCKEQRSEQRSDNKANITLLLRNMKMGASALAGKLIGWYQAADKHSSSISLSIEDAGFIHQACLRISEDLSELGRRLVQNTASEELTPRGFNLNCPCIGGAIQYGDTKTGKLSYAPHKAEIKKLWDIIFGDKEQEQIEIMLDLEALHSCVEQKTGGFKTVGEEDVSNNIGNMLAIFADLIYTGKQAKTITQALIGSFGLYVLDNVLRPKNELAEAYLNQIKTLKMEQIEGSSLFPR